MSRLLKQKSRLKNSSNLLRYLNPKSHIYDQYHSIRTSIQVSINEKNIKTIAVTSGEELEGKSTVAMNLAITFSEIGKKVLLVDANFRQPSVHSSFETNNRIGLSNVIIDGDSIKNCILISQIENLHLLTSGPVPSKPSELLGSKSMEALINDLKEIYDVIIFDTPNVLSVSDSLILTQICDSVLLVVRSNMNDAETIKSTGELLVNTKAYFLGAVLNDDRSKRKKKRKKI